MNRRLRWTLGIVLLLIGAATFAVSAQPSGGRGPGPGHQPPRIDFAAAASSLGVTEDALKDALGDPKQGPPDFAAAAQILGITEEALIEALGLPEGGPGDRSEGERRERRPRVDLAAAAEILGITEAELQSALGDPEQGPPDFATAAQILGITEEALLEALGLPLGGPNHGVQRPPNGGGQP